MTTAPPGLACAAPTAAVLDRWPLGTLAFGPAETARATAFRYEADRLDYLAAHTLARVVAGRALGVRAERVQLDARCPRCGGPHGPSEIVGHPEQSVSLTHTRGHVGAATAPGPLGIDIEVAGQRDVDQLIAHVNSPAEVALIAGAPARTDTFLRLWVRKEVLVKAGLGDLDELAALEVSSLALPGDTGGAARGRLAGLEFVEWSYSWEESQVLAAAGAAAPLVVLPLASLAAA